MTTPANQPDPATPPQQLTITVTRTDYAPGIENAWHVKAGDTHSTYHRSIDEALLLVRVLMERTERDERRPA